MIGSVKIKNFQRHKKLKVRLSPLVNVIHGKSDAGKTAVIRAINWCANNQPSGSDFRTKGSTKTKVSLKIQGNKISRVKTDSENLYRLNGKEYRAFGQGVPDDIKSTLNFDEITFQHQMDLPFLLSKSPGEAARFFNRIINLEKIDESQSNINSEINQLRSTLNLKEEQRKKRGEGLKEFEGLEEFKKGVKQCREQHDKLDKLKSKKELIFDVLNSFLGAQSKKKKMISIEELGKLKSSIPELESRLKKIQNLKRKREEVSNIVLALKKLSDKKNNLSSLLAKSQQEFKLKFPKICPLCETVLQKG